MTGRKPPMPGTVLPSALKILVSLLPVLVFLLALVFMDSYKLVRLKTLFVAILGGAAAAGTSYFAEFGADPSLP